MKWAVLSDIHGNLEAFKAVLDRLSKEDVDKVAFLGDVVGYGADPAKCTDLVNERTDITVAGNHDYGSVGLADTSCFNTVAKAAIEWTREQLSGDHLIFLSKLPLNSVEDDLHFVHSTPYNPQDWDYLFSWSDVIRGFHSFRNRICFIGHSHTPAIFIKDREGRVYSSKDFSIRLEEGFQYIINVGSVGQPRDGNPDAAFGIYDINEMKFTLNRIPYDVETAQRKIIEAGLPRYLATRIGVGR
ncbi:MAG: metallophosphoesterase family protein [Thermodesulfobacteriota bacterium]|nr:metallophosphoesterase family protein [Thermodesulfobacteriota bacterium]